MSNGTWSISGTISPPSAGDGTTVVFGGGGGGGSNSAKADSSGQYAFSGLANGTYTVTPTRTGYKFQPTNQSVTIIGANVTGVNFTGIDLTSLPPAPQNLRIVT
jgi:hypothetical protein